MIGRTILLLAALGIPAAAQGPLPATGLASKYSRDRGIEKDPKVVFAENFEEPRLEDLWDFYTYWCEMRGSPPRGQTWGNSFIAPPKPDVDKGKWICVEQMIAMNDVGDTNGEQALWIDGKLVSHLGKGFPKGKWTYDKFVPGKGGEGVRWNQQKGGPEWFRVPEGGAPFEGFRWRTVPDLKVNCVWLYIYTEREPGHRMQVWFDDVVLATEYVGPLSR